MVLGNAEDAANTISGFEFVSNNNYKDSEKVTADKLEVDLNTNHVQTIKNQGSDVFVLVINNSVDIRESAVIENAVGQNIRLGDTRGGSDVIAQVNTSSVNVDKFANYFYATEKNASVKIDSGLD